MANAGYGNHDTAQPGSAGNAAQPAGATPAAPPPGHVPHPPEEQVGNGRQGQDADHATTPGAGALPSGPQPDGEVDPGAG